MEVMTITPNSNPDRHLLDSRGYCLPKWDPRYSMAHTDLVKAAAGSTEKLTDEGLATQFKPSDEGLATQFPTLKDVRPLEIVQEEGFPRVTVRICVRARVRVSGVQDQLGLESGLMRCRTMYISDPSL